MATIAEQIERLENLINSGNKQITHKGKTVVRQDMSQLQARLERLYRMQGQSRSNQTVITLERL